MDLLPAKKQAIAELVRISKASFDSDVAVGATAPGGPPEYDDLAWHEKMARQGHLYAAYQEGALVGGALLFRDARDPQTMYVGRIFVDPGRFRRGLGTRIMQAIEDMDTDVRAWVLDTPIWNERTNRFYRKIGYAETRRDAEFVYYRKTRG